jgi:hypothetical protein
MTSQQYWWRIQSCGMWRRVDSCLGTNASEQLDASFFSVLEEDSAWTTLKMEAVSSSETHQAVRRHISQGCNNLQLSTWVCWWQRRTSQCCIYLWFIAWRCRQWDAAASDCKMVSECRRNQSNLIPDTLPPLCWRNWGKPKKTHRTARLCVKACKRDLLVRRRVSNGSTATA